MLALKLAVRVAEDSAILNLGNLNLFGCGETMVKHVLIIADKAGVSAEFIIKFVLRVRKNIALVIDSRCV